MNRVEFEKVFVVSKNRGERDVCVRGSVVGCVWQCAAGFGWRVNGEQGVEKSFRMAQWRAFEAAFAAEVAA